MPNDMYEDLVNILGDDIVASLEPGGDDPLAHAMGSGLHVAGTLAELNTKVSDATLDANTASRPPNGAAGGDLTGTFPNPTVNVNGVTSKATPVGADELLISDTEAANVSKKVTISALPVAAAQVAHTVQEIGADGAAAIVNTDTAIYLTSSTAASKGITTSSSYAGQVVDVFLLAASGGDYTLAVEGGTVTLDAALESVRVVRTNENDAWLMVQIVGATFA